MRARTSWLHLLFGLLLLASCATSTSFERDDIEGVWLWTAASALHDSVVLPDSLSAMLRSDDGGSIDFRANGEFTVDGPCNDVQGSYVVVDDRLAFTERFETLAGCLSPDWSSDEIELVERVLFDALGADVIIASLKDEGGIIELATEDVVLTFERVGSGP